MAVYRKKLVDKDGNTIIPAVGDIYGTVYTATLSNATAGGRADYEFAPDTPIENNKVYAVMFPDPTVNNATIILGDGVVSGSILVPPVAATDSPNYELLTTDMINNTEPLLLMYNGVQWVCLNQKKKVSTADLEDKAVKSDKIDWATFKFPIPDYSNGTSISNSTNTWTAPKCGVVVAVLVADTTNGYKEAKISVNNQTVATGLWAGATGGYNFQTRAIVPVATGDVVKFSAKDGGSEAVGRVFYPYKWV